MLEALPMAGFIQGNITDGPCGVSVSAGGMSFDRLTRKSPETAFKAQALDLATGKSEHIDLDPIGIYKLKIGIGTYRHRVTNEIIEEQTLISSDFGGESIGVWTSAGENGLGTKEEYKRVIDNTRTFVQTIGEAAMFWVSPGNSSSSNKPEHRGYLWKKDKNNEVTAYAYQLSGSRDSIGRMMMKMGYQDGERQIEDQVILTSHPSSITSGKVFNSYIDSLTLEEKARQSSYIEKFHQEIRITDNQRLEKLESVQKRFENELKAAYQGDIESALKSVLHGMLSLALEGVKEFSQSKGQASGSGRDGELIRKETPDAANRETNKADTNEVLLKPPNPDYSGRQNLLDIFVGKNRVREQDISKRIELLREVLIQVVVPQEELNFTVVNLPAVKPDGTEAKTIPNIADQMDLQKLSRLVAIFGGGKGDYSGVVGKDEKSGKIIGLQLIKPVEKAIIALSVAAELTGMGSLNLPREKTVENLIISDTDLDSVFSDFKKAMDSDSIDRMLESENLSNQPTKRIMSNPVILLKIYDRLNSKEERILVAVLMRNWLNGNYREKANRAGSKKATAEITQRDLRLWEIKRSEYGRILAWLIETVCVTRRQDYSRSEIELLTEIILLLCLLADRQDLLNQYISLENQGTVISDSEDRLKLERKPAAFNISGYQVFSFKTKTIKFKRKGVIYHYLSPLFVPCQA